MDFVLIVITVLALAMAAALAVVVVRLMRDERQRSDARAMLLAELAAEPAEIPSVAVRAVPRPAPFRSAPRDVAGDLELQPRSDRVTVPELFATPESASPLWRRFAIAGAFGVVALAIGTAVTLASRRSAPPSSPAHTVATQAPVATTPLELLSLRHSAHDSGLTITGLVQNPRSGRPISHVVATAFVFAADGSFLGSGRAPLDFTTLAPGDESPFVITVPVTGQIARYRVGFRGEDDSVISPIGRRGPDAFGPK